MRASTDRRRLLGALLALLLAATPALADRRAPPKSCSREDTNLIVPRDGGLLAEVVRRLPPPGSAAAAPLPPLQPALVTRFQEQGDLGVQLRAMRRFSVLRLWDSPHVRVFLGIDRSGLAGLHVQERDPREWPMPWLAAARIDRPIRAVPLSSP